MGISREDEPAILERVKAQAIGADSAESVDPQAFLDANNAYAGPSRRATP